MFIVTCYGALEIVGAITITITIIPFFLKGSYYCSFLVLCCLAHALCLLLGLSVNILNK